MLHSSSSLAHYLEPYRGQVRKEGALLGYSHQCLHWVWYLGSLWSSVERNRDSQVISQIQKLRAADLFQHPLLNYLRWTA